MGNPAQPKPTKPMDYNNEKIETIYEYGIRSIDVYGDTLSYYGAETKADIPSLVHCALEESESATSVWVTLRRMRGSMIEGTIEEGDVDLDENYNPVDTHFDDGYRIPSRFIK